MPTLKIVPVENAVILSKNCLSQACCNCFNFFFVCQQQITYTSWLYINICAKCQIDCLKTLRGVESINFLSAMDAQTTDGQTDRGKTLCPWLSSWGHKNPSPGSVTIVTVTIGTDFGNVDQNVLWDISNLGWIRLWYRELTVLGPWQRSDYSPGGRVNETYFPGC